MCAEDGPAGTSATGAKESAADGSRSTAADSSGSAADSSSEESEGELVVADTAARMDDGEPMGPSAADEAAMLADDDMPAVVAPPARPPGALPSLDSLLSRIPPPTRSALDEQLRARFVRVRKLKLGEMR